MKRVLAQRIGATERQDTSRRSGSRRNQPAASAMPLSFRVTRSKPREGFTLVELLAALFLCGLLISLVLGAVRTISRLTDAGRAQVEEAQILRSISRQMETEIASVVFTPPPTDGTATASGASG